MLAAHSKLKNVEWECTAWCKSVLIFPHPLFLLFQHSKKKKTSIVSVMMDSKSFVLTTNKVSSPVWTRNLLSQHLHRINIVHHTPTQRKLTLPLWTGLQNWKNKINQKRSLKLNIFPYFLQGCLVSM